jgi:hypothetical protein
MGVVYAAVIGNHDRDLQSRHHPIVELTDRSVMGAGGIFECRRA